MSEPTNQPAEGEHLPTAPEADATTPDPEPAPPAAPPLAPPVAMPVSGRTLGKVRNPVGCWLLELVTLGIYGLFWYHHTNKELRDYDPTIQVSPGWAVVCLFIPIVNWVSVYRTGTRIRQAQRTAGIPVSASGGIGVLLTFVVALWLPYYITQTNPIWQSATA